MAIIDDKRLDGAKILNIVLRNKSDSARYKDEYSNYELIITTSLGILIFAGCHDISGEIEIITAQELIEKYYQPANNNEKESDYGNGK